MWACPDHLDGLYGAERVRAPKDRWRIASSAMGLGTESAMLTQMKKAQGETNQRLDAIAALLTEILERQKALETQKTS